SRLELLIDANYSRRARPILEVPRGRVEAAVLSRRTRGSCFRLVGMFGRQTSCPCGGIVASVDLGSTVLLDAVPIRRGGPDRRENDGVPPLREEVHALLKRSAFAPTHLDI